MPKVKRIKIASVTRRVQLPASEDAIPGKVAAYEHVYREIILVTQADGAPGSPDNELPPGVDKPEQGLPGAPVTPDHELPELPDDWPDVPDHALPGAPVGPDNTLPSVPETPGNELPGGPPPTGPGSPDLPGNALPGGPPGTVDNTLPPGVDNTLPGTPPGTADNTLPGAPTPKT